MTKIAAVLVSLALLGGQALAESAVVADPSAQPSPDSNPCAAYGEGYRPVDGGKTCIRIGGRIRYDLRTGANKAPQDN